MSRFVIEKPFFEIFPDATIGILILHGIDNQVKEEDRFTEYLAGAQEAAQQYITEPEFTANPVVRTWRDAFYKFKTKKGARCSIEALLKRVSKGDTLRSIDPLVDIYNGMSLKYGLPIGGEDISKFVGDVRLTLAEGGEEFITYGSDKSEPPSPGEVVYKDDAGAICRCFNWRESVRTMLTEDTTDAFMVIEQVDKTRLDALNACLDDMAEMITRELGGEVTKYLADAESPEVIF